jgi:alanine dehydrogenase
MAILLLNENEVRQLLTMEMALEAVEQGLRKLALDEAENVPRSRCRTDHTMQHVLSAAAKTFGVLGYKAYTTSRQKAVFHVGLFDDKTGELLALLQADYLGQMRTGAASGVATHYLARPEASEVGLFGAGLQARTQIMAVCKVRKIKRVTVYSRNEENRRAFCDEMSVVCQCSFEPASKPEEAAQKKEIVITATNSRTPVLQGDWLSEGTHLNIVGSNFLSKAEIDPATIKRSQLQVVDNKDQAKIEAGDFHAAIEEGSLHWSNVRELGEVLTGRHPGRGSPSDITLFKSLGLGIEDVVTASKVVSRARELGVGRWVEWA